MFFIDVLNLKSHTIRRLLPNEPSVLSEIAILRDVNQKCLHPWEKKICLQLYRRFTFSQKTIVKIQRYCSQDTWMETDGCIDLPDKIIIIVPASVLNILDIWKKEPPPS